MTLHRKSEALVILCVLVSWSRGLDSDDKSAPCKLTNDDNRMVFVKCAHQNLTSIPDWPKQLSEIDEESHVVLSFFNNSITIITELSSIPGSQLSLSFQANRVEEIVPSAFSKLERLISLDLSKNCLSGQVLRSEILQGPYNGAGLYGNIGLEKLYLSFNKIHSLDAHLFQYTPNLTILFLDNNPIEILDRVTALALASAVNLETLDLSNTGIATIPDDTFRGLLKLKSIYLSGNRFVTIPESLKLVGKSLEYLYFNNNSIVELYDDSFIGLSQLKELEVGENDYLQEVKRGTFSPLKNLEMLHLCGNRNLGYISHHAFRGLKDKWTLRELYLNDNNLSELSPDLMPWFKLKVLGMTGNNWLCNCDLAYTVTTLKAGEKFEKNKIPFCASPINLHGVHLTNISNYVNFCPTLDSTFQAKKTFSLRDLRPKHVLWSIVGVALIVVIGMMLGMFVNVVKAFYNKIRSQPVRYINLNEDAIIA